MDKNFTKGLLLMVIVLIIPILVEAQTNSRILNRLPIPVLVHLTKRENLPFLLHGRIVIENRNCFKKLSGRSLLRCIVNSFENCINKPVYVNEPIYHLVKSCLDYCEKLKRQPYQQSICVRELYKQRTGKKKHLSDTLTLFKHDTREKSECTILLNLN